MKHYLFEIIDGDWEGEQFLVGADSLPEAIKIARDNFKTTPVKYLCRLSEFEAECSGLDEF